MATKRTSNFFHFLITLVFAFPVSSMAQQKEDLSKTASPPRLTLIQAEVCEGVDGQKAINTAVVFSKGNKDVYCLTVFDPVPEKTFIYHDWFFRDKRKRRVKLSLEPPRWSTFSRTEMRESDRGPWRVEIVDDDGNVLGVLRFSITD